MLLLDNKLSHSKEGPTCLVISQIVGLLTMQQHATRSCIYRCNYTVYQLHLYYLCGCHFVFDFRDLRGFLWDDDLFVIWQRILRVIH